METSGAPVDESARRGELAAALRATRARTDALFALLAPAAHYERPISERHRLIFYLGHLEAFDWNLLVRDCLGQPSRHAAWEQLFAFGIDPVDGNLPADVPADWPAVEVVAAWGRQLRADVDERLARARWSGWLQGGWALRLSIEHRVMHAETLSYLLHHLPLQHKRAGPMPRDLGGLPPAPQQVPIPAGHATLGRRRAAVPHDGWDNEYEEHRVPVPQFAIDRCAVTNAEWLTFLAAGGYEDRRLWTDDAWQWRVRHAVHRPAFWTGEPGAWQLRTMFGAVPLPPAWPVYVSHAEASAFARWRGLRLPTEAQWHRAALGAPDARERSFPWGEEAPVPGRHGNFGFWSFDPSPVDAHPAGQSAFGVHGLCGNGWQWTRTVFAPFEGFRPLPFYRGYSADFFDGRHYVAKGGSPVTETCLLRRSFRNWFQPHYPYVFASFRCVAD